MRQCIDQLQVTQRAFRHRYRQCIFDDIADSHIVIGGVEGVIAARFADCSVDAGQIERNRDWQRDVVIQPATAIGAITLEAAGTVDAGPLGNDAVIHRLTGQQAVIDEYIIFDGDQSTLGNINVRITISRTPYQGLCDDDAITCNHRRADSIASTGNCRVAGIDQSQVQAIGERDIEYIGRVDTGTSR